MLRQLRVCKELLSKFTDSLPYRHKIQLNAMTKARALAVLRGDCEVRQEDIDTVSWLSKWINYDFKEIWCALQGTP